VSWSRLYKAVAPERTGLQRLGVGSSRDIDHFVDATFA
jgi:hypothetical protein